MKKIIPIAIVIILGLCAVLFSVFTIVTVMQPLEYVEGKPATCTEDGNEPYYINKYNGTIYRDEDGKERYTREEIKIKSKGHNLESHIAKSPTCTQDGNIEYWECLRCGKYFSDKNGDNEIDGIPSISAIGHTYNAVSYPGEWVWARDYSAANFNFTCDVCKKMQEIQATISIIETEPKCEDIGKKLFIATVTIKGVEYCNEQDVDIPAEGHKITLVAEKAASCTKDGNIAYYSCKDCNSWFFDIEGKTKIIDKSSVVISKGHKLTIVEREAATCTMNGNIKYFICNGCDKWFLDELGKNEITDKLSVVIDKKHTFVDKVCSVCGALQPSDGLNYTSIGDFYEVSGIGAATDIDIVIPSDHNGIPVISIGYCAFANCRNLTSIIIPDSVTRIYDGAFSGCDSLKNITVEENNKNYSSQNGILYDKNKTKFIYIPQAISGSVTIPDGVISIGEWAFRNRSGLTNIIIGENVTSIGEQAFYNCSRLKSIIIPNSVISIRSYAFDKCNSLERVTTSVYALSYIPKSKLKTIIITGGSHIDSEVFNGCRSSLINVEISDSVIFIDMGTLWNCSNLESITLPFVGSSRKTTNDTYQYPFGYIFGNVSYDGGTATNQSYYGSNLSSLTSSIYYIPTKLKTVIITGGNILYGAFSNCNSLQNITLPSTATVLNRDACISCSNLKEVTISYGVTTIERGVFCDCKNLTKITIPVSVTIIGYESFWCCSNLAEIIFMGTKEQWNTISKGKGWNGYTGNYTIYCKDGVISK